MVRKDIVRLFIENMTLSPDGSYVIDLNGQRCRLDVEDTLFVVRRVEVREGTDGKGKGFFLLLSDETGEFLSAETLEIGDRGVLYCRVKQGGFKARFSRPAYYQITSYVEEDQGLFYLPLNGLRFPLLKGDS